MVITKRFSALGTTVEGGIVAPDRSGRALWDMIHRRVVGFENKFSRFKNNSELSEINRSAGREVSVSPDMADLMVAAKEAFVLSDGLVDPTIGSALIAAGYDRSFSEIEGRGDLGPVVTKRPPPVSLAAIHFSAHRRTLQLPTWLSLDFGGIGKGYLLDQLMAEVELVTENYWLALGGDLIVSGQDESGRPWVIGVQHPFNHDQDIAQLRLPVGRWGVATSGTTKRQGVRDGISWHHLIDPRTGRSADTDVVASTVVAKSALEADVLAKTVLLRGQREGLERLDVDTGYPGLIVTVDGRVLSTTNM